MELENMNYESEVMDNEIEVVESEGTGMSTGVAMLIGAGLTLATTAVVKLVKKGIAKHKAKKAQVQADEHDFVEPTTEEIAEVTK